MYPIDELANIVAMASEYEQIALTEDIKTQGQREPAVLWRGRIVDGRCRQLACHAIDVPLMVRELDSELTREEVAAVVKSLNTRRNLTDMQKAMIGVMQQEAAWITNEEIAKQWGLPLSTYKNARYIAMNMPDLVEPLFNGKSVEILDPDKGYVVTTNKINTLARIVKKTKERGIVVVDASEEVTFNVDSSIRTEAGKNWYYSRMAQLGIGNDQYGIRSDYVELANLKYKDAANA